MSGKDIRVMVRIDEKIKARIATYQETMLRRHGLEVSLAEAIRALMLVGLDNENEEIEGVT